MVDRAAISAGSDLIEQLGRDRIESADRRNVVDQLHVAARHRALDPPRRVQALGHRLVEEEVLAGPCGALDPLGLLVRRARERDDVDRGIVQQGLWRGRQFHSDGRGQSGRAARIVLPAGDDVGRRLCLQGGRDELAVRAAIPENADAIPLGASHP